MVVTKERNSSKLETPTSAYLNSGLLPEAANLSLRFNEYLLQTPTNPHVKKVWKILFDGKCIVYTTPDNVFDNTSIRRYFRRLLDYQTTSHIIEPLDISTYKYRQLYQALKSLTLNNSAISRNQLFTVIKVLKKLAENTNISIKDLHIEINADNEIAIFKKGYAGRHYILVGDEVDDISYIYISTTPGAYQSLHLGSTVSLNNIIDSFSEE